MMEYLYMMGWLILLVGATGILLSLFVRKRTSSEAHPFVIGVFSAVLFIPALFWAGGKLFHMRVDALPLIAAGIILLLFSLVRKR